MSSRGKKKLLLKLGLVGFVGAIGLAVFYGASQLMATLTRSSDTAEVFNDAATLPPELIEAVTWTDGGIGVEGNLDPLTLEAVTSAWLRAWTQVSILANTGATEGIDTYFTGSANWAMLEAKEDWVGHEARQISQTLTLNFVSLDGQVVGFDVDEARLVRRHTFDDGVGFFDSSERYEAVMVLADGNWRVQHWVRREVAGNWWSDPIKEPTQPFATELHGLNYFPRETPFDLFLAEYDSSVVAADLTRIRNLGFNSVRVFLDFEVLGGRWVDERRLAMVVDFMDLAAERDLGVVVTLFDGRTDHNVDKWDSDDAHLEAIVPTLATHPALVMWDLKNEADRDIGIEGVEAELVYAWLSHVGRTVRGIDPATPLTVGWSTPEAAVQAPVVVDVVSFHFYGRVNELAEGFEAVRAVAGDRAVLITEYGLPTWNSYFPGGHTEKEQAAYITNFLVEADRLGIDGLMIWTLWDLAFAPRDAGSLPWATGPQVNLGLLRADGSQKASAQVMTTDSRLELVPQSAFFDRFEKKFWKLVLGVAAGLVVILTVVAGSGLGRLRR